MNPLVQAMNLLGNRVGVLTGAIDRNTAILSGSGGRGTPQGGGSRGGGGIGGMFGRSMDPSALIGLFVGKIAAVVGPLAVLGSAISSHTSGFETFLLTGKMLGIVLGGLLMPGFIVLAAATYALAKSLDETVTPNLEYIFGVVLRDLLHQFQTLDGITRKLGEGFEWLGKVVVKGADLLASFLVSMGAAIKQIKPFGVPLPQANEIDAVLRQMADLIQAKVQFGAVAGGGDFGEDKAAGGKPGERPKISPDALGAVTGGAGMSTQPKGFMADMVRGMHMAVRSMQLAVAGLPTYTKGEEVVKEATLAGLGKDPFEKEMLDIMLKQLDAMNKVVSRLQPAVGP